MEVRRLFIDTGAFVGPVLPRDQFHKESLHTWGQIADSTIRLFSSEAVFQETMAFLHRAGAGLAIHWAEAQLEGKVITWLPVDPQVRRASLTWMKKYTDQGVSFVDATSFSLMRRENIRHVFSCDRHFTSAGFRLLRE